MKKVFSLLLVVAMLASLSLVAFAAEPNAAGGMHAIVTETAEDITVDVYVTNIDYCAGFNFIMTTDALTYVDGSAVLGDKFAVGKLTPSTKAGQIKFVHSFTDLSQYPTEEGTLLALSFKVEKAVETLTEENIFTYGTKSTTASKVVTGTGGTVAGQEAGNNFTSAKVPAYFTKAYVDARTSDDESDFSATATGSTITCIGKVAATATNYGVEFTAESTVEGARAQKYYGAMNGDTVSDGAEGTTTFTFGDWDGSFVIVLNGVTAGSKTLNFFVDDTIIPETTFTVVAE